MKVFFRADASVRIGTGHVMRCLTLAEELTHQGHTCEFICRDHPGHLRDFIAGKGFTCHVLTTSGLTEAKTAGRPELAHSDWLGVHWQTDAEQTRAILSGEEVHWLVVDHYALDSGWESNLRPDTSKIMVIDDLADRNHDCDLLLDQNLGRQEADYLNLVPDHCRRLVGPRHALLRPEFSALREPSLSRRAQPRLKRILVSLGGVDSDNVTGKVLRALENSALSPETELDIVMGATAPHLEEVRRLAQKSSFRAKVSVNVHDMAERMCLADLSIGAAGSTSWERCCLGLPSIMVILADNQRSIGTALAQSGSAYLLDKDKVMSELGLLVNRFVDSDKDLQALKDNAKEICDGEGTLRVASEMIRIFNS